MRDQPGDSGGLVELRAARKASIDHHRHPVERQRSFSDCCRQHDPPPTLRITLDRSALDSGFDLTVEWQNQRAGQLVSQPLADPLDLTDAGQEHQNVTRLLAPGGQHRTGHRVLYPQFGPRAQPFDRQRMGLACAFDNRCITQQFRKAGAVDRRAHHHQPQIGAQHRLAFDGQGQPQIAIEVPFVRLVKQHRRNASQLRIVQHGRNEDRLGHHQHAGSGAALAVEPGQIANRFAGCFTDQLGHPFGRRACSNPARREQDHAAVAPWLGQQCGGNRGCLARPRRRDQHGAVARTQGGQQVR